MNIKYSITNASDQSVPTPSPFGEGWGGASYPKSERSCSLPPWGTRPGLPGGLGWGFTVLLLLLLALAPAIAQTVVRTGETTTLAVENKGFDTFGWELYDNGTVNFATVSGNCPPTSADFVGGNVGASVNVKWLKAGLYFFKVTAWDVSGCSMNLKVGMIEIKAGVTAVLTPPSVAVCEGDSISLEVTFTGTGPWNFTYTGTDTDGGTTTNTVTNVTESPYTLKINPGPTKTTEYTVTSVSDIYGTNTEPSNTVTQTVNPLPVPSNIYHR